jgi:hypothetical protein
MQLINVSLFYTLHGAAPPRFIQVELELRRRAKYFSAAERNKYGYAPILQFASSTILSE